MNTASLQFHFLANYKLKPERGMGLLWHRHTYKSGKDLHFSFDCLWRLSLNFLHIGNLLFGTRFKISYQ